MYPLHISAVAITEKLISLENKADTMHKKSNSTEQDNREIALTVHNNPQMHERKQAFHVQVTEYHL